MAELDEHQSVYLSRCLTGLLAALTPSRGHDSGSRSLVKAIIVSTQEKIMSDWKDWKDNAHKAWFASRSGAGWRRLAFQIL